MAGGGSAILLGIVPIDRPVVVDDGGQLLWKIIKKPQKPKSMKINKYQNEKVFQYICHAINNMYEMGHVPLDIDDIELFLNKNGIYNIGLIEHLNKNSAQIQNLINGTNKIKHTHNVHYKIFSIIQNNNLFNDYKVHKNTIISQIISNDKNLKKQKTKHINKFKKKINDAINSKQLKSIIEFEARKQIPNNIKQTIPIPINWNISKFDKLKNLKMFNIIPNIVFDKFKIFSDDYNFIKNKYNTIHKILYGTNLADDFLSYNKYKQNAVFGKLLHEAYDSIMCAKFNILYKYIDSFYDINSVFTDDGYRIYKYKFYYNFREVISKLEKIERHLYFDFDMIVKDVLQLKSIYINVGESFKKIIKEYIPNFEICEVIIIAVFEWSQEREYDTNLTTLKRRPITNGTTVSCQLSVAD
ncbi:hypothetical protein QTP88_010136 [Uroleucon formosanum]